MGGSASNETPIHRVMLGAFSMGKTEVTQGQWKAVMGSNPSYLKDCGESCPVESVNWNDAKQFVSKLSANTGKTYRLPTEEEWEYACRAGGRQEYCGSEIADDVAWYKNMPFPPSLGTRPVATKKANNWGLHDMSGNVFEWTETCMHDYKESSTVKREREQILLVEGCRSRVVRGGSFGRDEHHMRSAYRESHNPSLEGIPKMAWVSLGFRVARTEQQSTK